MHNANEIYDRERNSSTNNISDDQQGSSEKVINVRDCLCALHTRCHYTYYRYWPAFMTLGDDHRWKARGFSSACKTTVCFKLAWFFIRKQRTIGRDLSSLGIENNRRARTGMYETKHAPKQKMHIFIHGNIAAEKNETECGAVLQGNCASNSRTHPKSEYFPRRIYLCQLTVLTSISSLELHQGVSFLYHRENLCLDKHLQNKSMSRIWI